MANESGSEAVEESVPSRQELLEFLSHELDRRDSRHTFLWTALGTGIAAILFVGQYAYRTLGSEALLDFDRAGMLYSGALIASLFAFPITNRLAEIFNPTSNPDSFAKEDAIALDGLLRNRGWPAFKRWTGLIRAFSFAFVIFASWLLVEHLKGLSLLLAYIIGAWALAGFLTAAFTMVVPGKWVARLASTGYHALAAAIPDAESELGLDQVKARPLLSRKPTPETRPQYLLGARIVVHGLKALEVFRLATVAIMLGWIAFHSKNPSQSEFIIGLSAVAGTILLGTIICLLAIDLYYDRSREWLGQLRLFAVKHSIPTGRAMILYSLVDRTRYHGYLCKATLPELIEAIEGPSLNGKDTATSPSPDAGPSA